MKKIKRVHLLLVILLCAAMTIPFRFEIRNWLRGGKTITERVEEFGPTVKARVQPWFDAVGVAYPPQKMVLVGIKDEKRLEVWVAGSGQKYKALHSYPIKAASGKPGPKLREWDMQVPEGLYKVESLNPNSAYHLALKVNYPNEYDEGKARQEGRKNLGGDIMIHGSNGSIGCLAMGDEAAEDLFVLAADTGLDNISVLLTPMDFRTKKLPVASAKLPDWTPELYRTLQGELSKLL